jgi:hypothetical protein
MCTGAQSGVVAASGGHDSFSTRASSVSRIWDMTGPPL